MVTEDYVSFETAKLLKEKGFDGECDYLYADGYIIRAQGGRCNWNKGETLFSDYKNECSAPTLQMVMKWLREVHNLHIRADRASKYWGYTIRKLKTFDTKDLAYNVDFSTYEEACKEAIKDCLENLI